MAKQGRKRRTVASRRRTATRGGGWTCPKHLKGDAAAAWKHVVGLLARDGNLGRTDPRLVEAYAINAALLKQAQERINEDGLMTLGVKSGLIVHPATAVINSATLRIKAIVSELGLSPATSKHAKSKGATPPSDVTKPAGKWDDFFSVVG